ncbi:MAG: OmpH family outer membrane protein [Vicinamibacterales bacterium]|nr:OmpH family outer membrane protein [Vicinamibacterales bacterium]
MRGLVLVALLVVTLAAVPVAAQTPAAPAPAQPPAAPAPEPPRPFPEGSKIAYIVLQRIAAESVEGREASGKVQALQQQRVGELSERQKNLQGLQAKLEQGGAVMSATAQADMQRQIERAQVDLERATQDAQAEVQALQQTLQDEFQERLIPVIEAVARDKNLHFIFNGPDSGLVWADVSLDISVDVIRKLDEMRKTPPQE